MRRVSLLLVMMVVALVVGSGVALAAVKYGTNGHDVLIGTPGEDVLYGRGGSDFMDGTDGSDILFGGPGRDGLCGDDCLQGMGTGDDILFGGPGNDKMTGDGGDDTLYGQDGDDSIEGLSGRDTIFCGPGKDTVYYQEGVDRIFDCERNLATIPIRPGHHNNFPAWSPDGTKIAFASSQGQLKLYVMEVDGSGLRRITNTPKTTYESDPAWSPDGKRIAFSRGKGNIYTIKVDGTGLRQLTDTKEVSEVEPTWSPDGKEIAFSRSGRTGDQRRFHVDIYTMNAADGSQQRNLTQSLRAQATGPAWSPDGKKIAFSSATDIFLMKANVTGHTNLTNNPANDEYPTWSPDGKKIAFSSSRAGDNEGDIFVMEADGKKVEQLTKTRAFESSPDWRQLP